MQKEDKEIATDKKKREGTIFEALPESSEEITRRVWSVPANIGVYLLLLGALLYIGYSIYEQRRRGALIEELAGDRKEEARKALLSAGKAAHPHLLSAIVYHPNIQVRLEAVQILHKKAGQLRLSTHLYGEDLGKYLTQQIDPENLSRALYDEAREVRIEADQVLQIIGTTGSHQEYRLAQRRSLEATLNALISSEAGLRKKAEDVLLETAESTPVVFPFLVGTLLGTDEGKKIKALNLAYTILKGKKDRGFRVDVLSMLGYRPVRLLIQEVASPDPALADLSRKILTLDGKISEKTLKKVGDNLRRASPEERKKIVEKTLSIVEKGEE